MVKLSKTPIDDKLADLRKEAEERDAARISGMENIPYINLRETPIETEALELLSEKIAKETAILIFKKEGDEAHVATRSSASEGYAKAKLLLEEKGLVVVPRIASISSIREAQEKYKSIKEEEMGGAANRIEIKEGEIKERISLEDVEKEIGEIREGLDTSKILKTITKGALSLRASDIHVEARAKNTEIRYRVDGALHSAGSIKSEIGARISSRIKLLSNLKLNIKDEAQDGRFTIYKNERPVEVRASIVPSEYGESLVLRVLDPELVGLGITDLGMGELDEKTVRRVIKNPNGMILTTGPTGSGKTTTLYAFLKEKNKSQNKLITIEDPIEYHLEGVEQTQVSEEDNYTFVSGLRSILRQDPDVIMIGEIRDEETAKTAVDASLTGHLVFSTLHTNDSIGTIPRLIDLGVEPSVLGSALNIVISQRLVRKLCPSCAKEKEPTQEMKENIENFLSSMPEDRRVKSWSLRENGDCKECLGGFKGRVGLFELFEVDERIEEILNEVEEDKNIINKLKKITQEKRMISLKEDGILKALNGDTTLEEVESIAGPIDWTVYKNRE